MKSEQAAQQKLKVVVTGAGGFIGRSVAQRLGASGHEVIPIVRVAGSVTGTGGQPAIQIDLSEPYGLESLRHVCQNRVDVLIHLAAMIPTAFGGVEAQRVAEINREIDQNVFRACEGLGIRIVYATSTSVYGFAGEALKVEGSPVHPLGPYAEAKLAAEELGRDFGSRNGVPFAALRIAAPYGPGNRLRTVLNIFVDRAIEGLPLMYHGSGSRRQDFTYVTDVADAAIGAAIRAASGIYNISGGSPVTMRELANLVVRCVPHSPSVVSPSGEVDPQEGVASAYDINKALTELLWEPVVSLQSGITACVKYRLKERDESRTPV